MSLRLIDWVQIMSVVIVFISILVLAIVKREVDSLLETTSLTHERVVVDGHRYIVFSGKAGGIVHDPDCPCSWDNKDRGTEFKVSGDVPAVIRPGEKQFRHNGHWWEVVTGLNGETRVRHCSDCPCLVGERGSK